MIFDWKVHHVLREPLYRLFIFIMGIDIDECQKKLINFNTLGDLFSREIKASSRPFSAGLISPVDGRIRRFSIGGLNDRIKIKNYYYSIKDVIQSKENKHYHYLNIYLSPRNYHRVHAPIDGYIQYIRYIPGSLLPVSPPFDRIFGDLSINNERLIFKIQYYDTSIYIVMIGGICVGKMETGFIKKFSQLIVHQEKPENITLIVPLRLIEVVN